jgi:DNA polymerase
MRMPPRATAKFGPLSTVITYRPPTNRPTWWGQNFRAVSEAAITMGGMPDAYAMLLESTIQHLRDLKARGVRYVVASPAALAAVSAPRKARAAAPVARATVTPAAPVSAPVVSRPLPVPAAPAISPAKSSPVSSPSLATPAVAKVEFSSPAGGVPPVAAPELSPEAKAAAFAELRARALACLKCDHLASSRKTVVFGVGSLEAELMFVGEAPGADEDEQGEPFVGRAGELLTKIIVAMGLKREQVYIANILKCRPDTPGQSAGNRKPTPEEMRTCIPFLHEQIDLIRPKALVALGATAVEGLLGKTIGITRLRGNWRTYRGIPLMPTYHPAYLLRNQAITEKRKVWEDMLQVMDKLGMAISEKQRNFFLKAAA